MNYFTGIFQGSFTSDGTNRIIQLRSDVDWIRVVNTTQAAATNDVATEFFWQREMVGVIGGEYKYKFNASDALAQNVFADGVGFNLIDTSGNPLGAQIATTASTGATQPVVSTANTSGLATGSVIRYFTPAASAVQQLGGIDFEIDTVVANTSFRFRYALATAPAVGGAGSYRIVNFDPLFYPRFRYIANITAANPAVITTTVSHGYTAGQTIRISVPSSAYGMTEIDGIQATVTAVTASTITTDVDASAFTAFTFPLDASYPFSPATVGPVGEAATATYQNLLNDATDNQGFIGIKLDGGADLPAGANNDVMMWVAGKSFSTGN